MITGKGEKRNGGFGMGGGLRQENIHAVCLQKLYEQDKRTVPLSGFRCLAVWKSFLIWFDLIHSCGMGLHFLHFLHGNGEQVTGFQHQGFFLQRIYPQYSISSETGIAAVYTITEFVAFLRDVSSKHSERGGERRRFKTRFYTIAVGSGSGRFPRPEAEDPLTRRKEGKK